MDSRSEGEIVRRRKAWMTLPTVAALGAFSWTTIPSWLSAQEPPPFGYYPPKISPSQPGLIPAGGIPHTSMEVRTVNGQPIGNSTVPNKLTSPVVVGPNVQSQPGAGSFIRPASANEPVRPAPIAIASTPPVITPPSMALPIVNPPMVTPPRPLGTAITETGNSPVSAPAPRTVPIPAPTFIGQPLKAPEITVESSIPEPPTTPEIQKPAPTTPSILKPVPPNQPLSTRLAPPAFEHSPAPIGPELANSRMPASVSRFPFANMGSKSAPSVVLETIAPESVSINQPFTYELVVRNTGATTVANVRLEDEPPAKSVFVSSDPVSETVNGRQVWSLGTLDAGAEKRIKMTVRPTDEGEIRSRAVVSFSTGSESKVKVTRPKINLVLSTVETARVGDEIAFTIRVTNTGTGPASKMTIQANLTEGLNHTQGTVIETELANLPSGESRTLTLRTLATKSGAQALTLSVIADGNPAEVAKSQVMIVEPMLSVQVDGPAKCLVRAEPEFKIELKNPGTAATDPIVVMASVPEGFEFISASDSGSVQSGTRLIVWKLSSLGASTQKELKLKLRATEMVDGSIKVQAIAGSGDDVEDGVKPASARLGRSLEAKAESVVKAEGVPALRFEVRDLEDPIEVGKEAIYEIKVENQGTAPCTNVQIMATLADGTTATGANGPTQARGQGQQVTFDTLATLATKQVVVFKVKVKGAVSGDQRFRVQVVCDQIRTPISKEESTRFVKN